MYNIILENAAGYQLNFAQNSAFTVTEIQGLNPPAANINTSQIALMDGGKYNSAKMQMRTLNIAFAIEYEAAKNRLEVFKVLKSKQWIKFNYIGQYRQVYIEGYISSIDISYFAMKQIVTCSILCPSPYFMAAQAIVEELSNIIGAFHFPFHSEVSKNLMQNTAQDKTMNGITFSIYNDASVIVNGTATDNAYLTINNTLADFMSVGEAYILSGCPEGGSVNGYRLQMVYNGIGTAGYDTGEGVTIIPTADINQPSNVAIYINSGVTCNNLIFHPMIRSAEVTDGTYQDHDDLDVDKILFGYISTDVGITMNNDGDVETGMIIELFARQAVSNPKIFDYITQDYIGVNFDMQQYDIIRIDTRQGHKTVTLQRGGVESNLFNYIMQGSTWLQLPATSGTYVYEVGTGETTSLAVSFTHTNLYEGV